MPDSELDVEAIADRVIAEEASKQRHGQRIYRVAARMLNEHLGGKRPVYRITGRRRPGLQRRPLEDARQLSKRFPGKTLPQAIEANAKLARPYPALDTTTIRDKWLARTSSILKFAVNNRLIPDKPVRNP